MKAKNLIALVLVLTGFAVTRYEPEETSKFNKA